MVVFSTGHSAIKAYQQKMGSGMSIDLFVEPDYEGIEEWGQIYLSTLYSSEHCLRFQCSHSIGQFQGFFEPGQPLCRRGGGRQLKEPAFIFLKRRPPFRGSLPFASRLTHLLAVFRVFGFILMRHGAMSLLGYSNCPSVHYRNRGPSALPTTNPL